MGFRGFPWSSKSETYNLKMYNVMAVDPMTGIPMIFRYSNKRNEIALASEMIVSFEENSISIYDQLYFSFKMVVMHKWSNNYLLFRCKKGTTLKVVIDFVKSNDREQIVDIAGAKVRLIKQKNKTGTSDNIFATNLPTEDFNNNEIQKLYFRRWESEISNRDLSCTLKAEQFHTSNLNGILQEIYMSSWYMTYSKMEVMKGVNSKEDFLADSYIKANNKEAMTFILHNIPDLIINMNKEIYRKLKFIIGRSIEKRKRLKRSFPRQVKSSRSRSYINASTVPKRST